LPSKDSAPYSDAYDLLIALGRHAPASAQADFEEYLKSGAVQRALNVIYVLRETCSELSVRVLAPLLTDKRPSRESYCVHQDESAPYLPMRVCDEAAVTIAMHSKTLKFVLKGSHEDLDRQIENMRAGIVALNKST
jgi:hypothetical protein